MVKIERRAHDRDGEAVAHRRTWMIVGIALLATLIIGGVGLRALIRH